MEEILASIRRIIADDEAGKPDEAGRPASEPASARSGSNEQPASGPRPVQAAQPEPSAASDSDIETMLAEFDQEDDDPESEGSGDVLELTEAMESPPPQAANFRTIEPSADVMFAETPNRERAAPAAPYAHHAEEPPRLMSEDATSAVSSAFNSLAHTVLMQNARTLDDLVREMLRPMLKNWLDENLPTIVERLVRAEIDRVSRGQG
jgi:cell pole-organizing protein PopZ